VTCVLRYYAYKYGAHENGNLNDGRDTLRHCIVCNACWLQVLRACALKYYVYKYRAHKYGTPHDGRDTLRHCRVSCAPRCRLKVLCIFKYRVVCHVSRQLSVEVLRASCIKVLCVFVY